jgi:glycosyltransferase involved in cell wall biosynthesis
MHVGHCGTLSVCHVVSGDAWAGAEAQVATLLRGLCRLRELRVSAILLNEGRLAEELRCAGAVVKVIPESKLSYAALVRQAAEFLREQGVQVLHSHRYKENLLAAMLGVTLRIPNQVRTVHGMREPFRGWSGVRHHLIHGLDHWTGRFAADAVISVSDGMAERLAAMYGASKVAVIRNGVETNRLHSRYGRAEAHEHIGCAAAPVVGIAGRLVPVKRLDLFLQMAASIQRLMPSAQFVIAGDGPERARLVEQARALGIESSVHFLGHREDIHDVLRAMDVLVMCSDHEGLPMTLLEALWLDVPVVGRHVPGIREVLRDGQYGLCIEGDDAEALATACLRLLHNPGLAQSLCKAASRYIAQEFSAENNAAEVALLYQRLAVR